MANFVRTDRMLQPKQASGRRPIVLARIPHASADDARMILPLTGAGNADQVAVEEPPSINSPPASVASSVPLTKNFVDHRHVAIETPSAPRREPTDEISRSSHSRSHSSEVTRERSHARQSVKSPGQTSRSTSKANGLCKLHSQVAPYSGAIVALALLLSAGLLYWMTVAPNREPADFRSTNYGSFEASTADLPSFTPGVSSDMPEDITLDENETFAEDLPWWETEELKIDESAIALEKAVPPIEEPHLLMDGPELVAEAPEVVFEPTAEKVAVSRSEPTSNSSVDLVFPSTNRPQALDFSKFNAAVPSEPQSVPVRQAPTIEVGKRPLSRILTPIKG